MALNAKFLVLIAITILYAWTDQTFGVELELTRELPGTCINNDNGGWITDKRGYNCFDYQYYDAVVECGKFDDDDFSANAMCCFCKKHVENGYTLIAHEDKCRHRRNANRELPFCYNNTDIGVNDRSSCASYCTNGASCVGFAFGPSSYGEAACHLYQNGECPSSDWDINEGDGFLNFTANDMKPYSWTFTGWQCYGKNSAYVRDCEWGSWDEWSTCSTCSTSSNEEGEQSRTRQVKVPASNGGQACVDGEATETATCNTDQCPVDCEWGTWFEWSTCSKTCGGGEQSRTRQVEVPASNGGQACVDGEASETARCNTNWCPVDCEWGSWVEWSPCSKTCGRGMMSRIRLVSQPASNGGHACEGEATEAKECNKAKCREECLDIKPRDKCRSKMMNGKCTKPYWKKNCCISCRAGCGNLWSDKKCQKHGAFCQRKEVRKKCRKMCRMC